MTSSAQSTSSLAKTRLRLRLRWLTLLGVAGLFTSGAFGLELKKEIGRMPADKRPSATEVKAAEDEETAQKQHEDEVWTRIEPEVLAWAAKGKPYLPHAIIPSDLPQATIPAFPGAEGAGRFSFGGRGGKVYVVTSLADSGPGTFREACEAAGPRIVVFNVAGIIQLTRPVHIQAPYITIAGQSAPGDGICIAGRTTHVDTHDVVIRYIRFRRGTINLFERDDALGGNPIGNIIVDHCSTSWGLDENLSMYRHVYKPKNGQPDEKLPTLNITLQWCLSSEALDSFGHAFGGTWGGRNSSLHHNLFASNTGRNPSIGMSYDFNFTNNVVFNWKHRSLDGGDRDSQVNCINNYYKPGPITQDNAVRHRVGLPQSSKTKEDPTPRYGKWYAAGNYVEGDEKVTADNWAGGIQFQIAGSKEEAETAREEAAAALIEKVRVRDPFPLPPVTLQTAQEAYTTVLADVGATLPKRDPVDTRVLAEVKEGKFVYEKGIITDIKQVGGYPNYQGVTDPQVGADGIPLWWKNHYKLDVKDTTLAAKDLQGDGYTVIEKYLDGLDPTKRFDAKNPQQNRNTLSAAAFQTPHA